MERDSRDNQSKEKTTTGDSDRQEDVRFNPSNAEDTFIQSTRTQNILENHLNPVMLVFIG